MKGPGEQSSRDLFNGTVPEMGTEEARKAKIRREIWINLIIYIFSKAHICIHI